MRNSRCWAVMVLAAALVGCSDDPFAINWEANPLESVVYALDVEELGVPTAFDVAGRSPVVIESPTLEGDWDFAVAREDGGLVLLPAPVLGITSRAAIVRIPGTSLEEVAIAPSDSTRYVSDAAVPLELGNVYVVRTHEQRERGGFGRLCVFYGKLEPLEIDVGVGRVRFIQDASPECNDRGLVPD